MRAVAALNEPRFHTAKPKPSRMLRANVGASAFDHMAAVDWVASTAKPITTNARMPSTVNMVRDRNAASKAPRE